MTGRPSSWRSVSSRRRCQFCVRGEQVFVGHAECDARPDLGEAAGHEPVVDVHAGEIVHQVPGDDDPGDSPGDHASLQQIADRDGPVAHAGKGGRMDHAPAVEQHALVVCPVQQTQVTAGDHLSDRFPLFAGGDPAGREGGVVDEDDPGPLAHRGPKGSPGRAATSRRPRTGERGGEPPRRAGHD